MRIMDDSQVLRIAWDVANSLDQPADQPDELWAQTRHDMYSVAIEAAWTDISNARRRGREPLERYVAAKARSSVMRAMAHDMQVDPLEGDLPCDADSVPDPPRAMLDAEQAQEVRVAVACLPAAEQRVIRLRFWEANTRANVAEMMGLTPSQVETLEARALAMLREAMD